MWLILLSFSLLYPVRRGLLFFSLYFCFVLLHAPSERKPSGQVSLAGRGNAKKDTTKQGMYGKEMGPNSLSRVEETHGGRILYGSWSGLNYSTVMHIVVYFYMIHLLLLEVQVFVCDS